MSESQNAGAIYDLGQLKYIVSATYATTAILGMSMDMDDGGRRNEGDKPQRKRSLLKGLLGG